MTNEKIFLHVGCGQNTKNKTTTEFAKCHWTETRYDIDSRVMPDIVGDMLDLSEIPDQTYDAVYSSHNIEHLYFHQVPIALREFLRVLKPSGYLVITCPDRQSVAELVAEDKLTEPVYVSPAGPIEPIDILYGYRPSLAKGNNYMAHNCGFTRTVLEHTLNNAGYRATVTLRRKIPFCDLWSVAFKSKSPREMLEKTARLHFPVG